MTIREEFSQWKQMLKLMQTVTGIRFLVVIGLYLLTMMLLYNSGIFLRVNPILSVILLALGSIVIPVLIEYSFFLGRKIQMLETSTFVEFADNLDAAKWASKQKRVLEKSRRHPVTRENYWEWRQEAELLNYPKLPMTSFDQERVKLFSRLLDFNEERQEQLASVLDDRREEVRNLRLHLYQVLEDAQHNGIQTASITAAQKYLDTREN